MSDQEFENYLTLIGRLLRLSSSQRKAIGEELRDHFELRLTELVENGLSHAEAVRLALEEFGDAAGLAAQFTTVSQTRKRRLVMRCTVGSVVALAAVLVIVMASWPDRHAGLMVDRAEAQTAEKQQETAKVAARDQAADDTEKKLNESFDVSFQEAPLQDVVLFLRDKFKVQILFDTKVLSDAGIDPTTLPISAELSRVRVAKFLDLVLQANGLGYIIDKDGFINISTKEDLETRVVLRIYDCRKMLSSESTVPNNPLAQSKGEPTQSKPKAPAEKLIEVICTTIFKDTWNEAGGPGTITEYGGLLVVSQTQMAHEQIADLLEQLEERLATPVAK